MHLNHCHTELHKKVKIESSNVIGSKFIVELLMLIADTNK